MLILQALLSPPRTGITYAKVYITNLISNILLINLAFILLKLRNALMPVEKASILADLQSEILRLQGFRPIAGSVFDLGLGPIRDALPEGIFPVGCVHEFISTQAEEVAATHGFVSGLLSGIMHTHGAVFWISSCLALFPPALKSFGISPDRFVFIDLTNEKQVLWCMEEALKCGALAAVVGEINDISFVESRRLQLAVEQSQVAGFVLRNRCLKETTTACVSRWRIRPSMSSGLEDGLPGIGYPTWRVELLRMRHGKAGVWNMRWENGHFVPAEIAGIEHAIQSPDYGEQKKVG